MVGWLGERWAGEDCLLKGLRLPNSGSRPFFPPEPALDPGLALEGEVAVVAHTDGW